MRARAVAHPCPRRTCRTAALALLASMVGVGLAAPAPAQAATRTLTGYVVHGPGGSPAAGIAGVTVTAYQPDGTVEARTTTDENGAYSVPVSDATRKVCAEQEAPTGGRTLSTTCGAVFNGSATLDLAMVRVTTISGAVVTTSGTTVPAEELVALYEYDEDRGWQRVGGFDPAQATVKDGRFRIDDVPDGNYRLCLLGSASPSIGGCAGGAQVEDAEDVLVRGGPLVVNIAAVRTGHVRGTLSTTSGSFDWANIDAYRVVGDGRGGTRVEYVSGTIADGTTYAMDLVPGRYRFRYQVDDVSRYLPVWDGGVNRIESAPDVVVTPERTTTVNVTAPKASSISGQVTGDFSAEPGERPTVAVVNVATGEVSEADAPGGTWVAFGLAAGSYRVELDRAADRVEAAQRYPEVPESAGVGPAGVISVGTGEVRTGVDQGLGPGRTATGVVRSAGGGVIVGARVTAFTDDDHLVSRTGVTSATGSFTIPGLQISNYKVAVELPGGRGTVFVDGDGDPDLTADRGAAVPRTVTAQGLALGTLSAPYRLSPAPTLIGTPGITGSPVVGGSLTADPGSWDTGGLTYTYRWLRHTDFRFGTDRYLPIVGATSRTYSPTAQDVGHRLSVEVFASRRDASFGRASSSPTDPVGSAPRLAAVAPPRLSASEPAVAQRLSVGGGTWSATPTSTAYQWYRDGTPIHGATTASYTPIPADEGQVLSVVEVVQRTGYRSGSVQVTAGRPTRASTVITSTGRPTMTGTATVGATLSATSGTWSVSDLAYAYQWYAGTSPIPGATSASYTIGGQQRGRSLSVRVTASKAGYAPVTAASTATGPVLAGTFTVTEGPSIEGTGVIGSTLTYVRADVTPRPTSFRLAWLRNGVPIGVSTPTYTLTAADRATTVSVRVVYGRLGYRSEQRQAVGVLIPPS